MAEERDDEVPGDQPSDNVDVPVEPDWKRRKRIAELFGEVLPEVSGDERAREGGDRKGTPDEWFRRQVPPHHG